MRRILATVVFFIAAWLSISLAVAQSSQLKPGDPPIASLISISAPDESGLVTITGAAGAVFPSAQVAVRNLYTEQVVYTQAGITGSFNVNLFGPGNTPFWISPTTSIPPERRNRPGSLPGGPGVIIYGAFPETRQTTAPITQLVVDGQLDDWDAYSQASENVLRNQESIYVAIESAGIPQNYVQVQVTFTLDGTSYAVTLDPRLLQTATLRRTAPNEADLGTLGVAAAQVDAIELRIPLAAVDSTIQSAAVNQIRFIGADGSEIRALTLQSELPFVDEIDGIVYADARLSGSNVTRFSVSGTLAQGTYYWTARGRTETLDYAPGDTLLMELDVTMNAPELAASLTGLKMIGQIGLQPVTDADGVQAAGGLNSNNGWSSLTTPSGLAIDNLRADFILGEAVVQPQQVIRRGAQVVFGFRFELPVPDDLPTGLYVPFFHGMGQVGDGEIFSWEDNGLFGFNETPISRVPLTRLPIVLNVGEIELAHLTWALFYDHPSDGSRGILSEADRSAVALSNRVRFDSPTYILPPASYPIEPYLLNQLPNAYDTVAAPLLPLLMPGGRLSARVTLPNGGVDNIGTASILQNWVSGAAIDERTVFGTSSPVDVFRITTLSPQFLAYPFTEYGEYQVNLFGSVEDVWGNRYDGGGVYSVLIAELLDMTPAVLSGTPFEVSDAFYPALHLSPNVSADVTITVRLYPLDGSETIEQTFEGQANRFGFFQAAENFTFDVPGEYVVDYEARYAGADGKVWAGSLRSAGVIARPDSDLVAHGRRGLSDYDAEARPAWFNTQEYPTSGANVSMTLNAPYFSGDVAWMVDNSSSGIRPIMDAQDLDGAYENWLLGTLPDYVSPFGEPMARLVRQDELPLLSVIGGPQSLYSPALIPELTVNQAYAYISAVRPGVSVRQYVQGSDDEGLSVSWNAQDPYNGQIGVGVNGDREGDFTFLFGGAVVRNAEAGIQDTAIYAALAVTVEEDDDIGARVYPPLRGDSGGGNGGALLTLRNQEISLFFHATGAQPGQVFTRGETLAIVGQVAPTLASNVVVTVTAPSGDKRQFSDVANAIGYFYAPENNFALDEIGVWLVDIKVTHRGLTSAGVVEPPYSTGGILGAVNGSFRVYVVPEEAPPLNWQEGGDIDRATRAASPINFSLNAPQGWTNSRAFYTITMPGYILEEGEIRNFAQIVSYQYSPSQLSNTFPNLEIDQRAVGSTASDVVTLTFYITGTDETGRIQARSRTFTVLHDRLVTVETQQ